MQSIDSMSTEELRAELIQYRDAVPQLVTVSQSLQGQLMSYKEGYSEKSKQVKDLLDLVKAIAEDPEIAEHIDFDHVQKTIVERGVTH